MGDVNSLEIAVPAGARSVRIAYVMGDDGGHSEDQSPLWRDGEPASGGEAIDVHVTYPDEFRTSGSMCPPLNEGAERYVSYRKHELSLTGPTPALDAWTPVYLRAWTPIEMGVSGSGRHVDLASAFTIQVLFSASEFEQMSTEMPLNSAGLMQVPAVRWLADPFSN